MQRLAFIGLGVMGYPMAGHLQGAGHHVTVFNRTASRADRWQAEYGGACAGSPRAAASDADVVFCCVGDDNDLRAVTLGDQGAFAGMRAGSVFVDHTTASAAVARELAADAASRGIAFVDAPVSGGQAGAERGRLTVMAGGDEATIARVTPLLNHYAHRVRRVGPHGHGQLAKMVNQVCIAGLLQGLAEALHFGRRAGLDMDAVYEVISGGAAQSWQLDNRFHTMLEGAFEHGFAVDWMRKDLDIVLAEARRNGSTLPVTALVDQFYADVQALGGGRWDTSSLLLRLDPTEGE